MREGMAETHTVVRLQTHGNLRRPWSPRMKVSTARALGIGVMDRSRRLLGGPQISSSAVDPGLTLSPGT
jgi:hypothetical protein